MCAYLFRISFRHGLFSMVNSYDKLDRKNEIVLTVSVLGLFELSKVSRQKSICILCAWR